MTGERKMSKTQQKACCVLFVTFNDGRKGTFYSNDHTKPSQAGNLHYWTTYFQNYISTKWAGKVSEYALFRSLNGRYTGDPIIKEVL